MKTNLETLLQNLETARKNATQGEIKSYWNEKTSRFEIYNGPPAYEAIARFAHSDDRPSTKTLAENDSKAFAMMANHILQLIEIIRVQKEALAKASDENFLTDTSFLAVNPPRNAAVYDIQNAIDKANAKVEEIAKESK